MNNLEVDVTFYKGANVDAWFAISQRADDPPSWVNDSTPPPNAILPYNGYVLRLRFGSVSGSVFRKVIDGVSTGLISDFDANIAGVDQECRVRFQVNGTTLRFKEWLTADTEPASWTEVTDSTFGAAGTTRIGFATGASGTGTYDLNIRALTVTDLDTGGNVFTASYTEANGSPWPSDQFDPIETYGSMVMDQQTGEGRFAGDVDEWGRAVLTLSADETLATPTGFSFTAASGVRSLEGSWNPVAEAETYDWEVERDDGGTWVAFDAANTGSTTFQLTDADGVAWSTTYRARVRSVPPVA